MPLELTQGWTAPIRFALKIDGIMTTSFSTQDVSSLLLHAADGQLILSTGTVLLVACATTTYNATYSPGSSDFLVGRSPYSARFKLTDAAGKVQFFPNSVAERVTVYPQ